MFYKKKFIHYNCINSILFNIFRWKSQLYHFLYKKTIQRKSQAIAKLPMRLSTVVFSTYVYV